jgi:hypothetical protein
MQIIMTLVLRIYLDIHIYFYHRVDTTDIVSYHPLSSQCFNVILHDSINIFIIGTEAHIFAYVGHVVMFTSTRRRIPVLAYRL